MLTSALVAIALAIAVLLIVGFLALAHTKKRPDGQQQARDELKKLYLRDGVDEKVVKQLEERAGVVSVFTLKRLIDDPPGIYTTDLCQDAAKGLLPYWAAHIVLQKNWSIADLRAELERQLQKG